MNNNQPLPKPKQIQQLTCFNRVTIDETHMDVMGHMNIRHYMTIYDEAAWRFFPTFGLDDEYYATTSGGAFALQQFIRYQAEVHMGDTVSVYSRLVGFSAKRIQVIYFMVNETHRKLASTMEVLVSHADLIKRRTSPFPKQISDQLAAMLSDHNKLDWDAPLCGIIHP